MRKILVTGAAGFVGRHITRRLLEAGDEVHAVDNITPLGGGIDPGEGWPLFDPRDFPSFHFYHENCRDFFNRVSDDDFDCCFHLAAVVGGRLVIENNPLAVAEDLSIDAEYWRWAVKARPGRTACFSSSAVYPVELQRQASYELLKEDMIDFGKSIGMPDMTYGWAKLTCEYLGRLAYEKHGLKSIVYRPFSGYGEDQDDAYPFPSICKRALANQDSSTLSVWGTGEQMRDFIHIEDCLDGIFQTLPLIDNAEAVNLSTGVFTSFRQFARIAADVCGYNPEIVGLSDKPSGVFARAGDTSKQKKLGFTPQIDLRRGIERAVECYSRNL